MLTCPCHLTTLMYNILNNIATAYYRRESEESGGTDSVADTPHVDLFQLQMNTLRLFLNNEI